MPPSVRAEMAVEVRGISSTVHRPDGGTVYGCILAKDLSQNASVDRSSGEG